MFRSGLKWVKGQIIAISMEPTRYFGFESMNMNRLWFGGGGRGGGGFKVVNTARLFTSIHMEQAGLYIEILKNSCKVLVQFLWLLAKSTVG